MFNYIASALMGYLLVDVLRVPGPDERRRRAASRRARIVPQFHELLRPLGITGR